MTVIAACWILDWNDFSYFFWSTSHPDASYQVSSQMELLIQEKKRKIDFQDGHHGGHLGLPTWTILAIFVLQVTPMPPTKFQVNWPFGVDLKDFTDFWSTSHPNASYQVSGQLAFWFMKQKIGLQDGHHCGTFGFPIRMILAAFDLQVTPMLPTKFQVI